jgi:hypothetical protein
MNQIDRLKQAIKIAHNHAQSLAGLLKCAWAARKFMAIRARSDGGQQRQARHMRFTL